jgi:hypothetical protein
VTTVLPTPASLALGCVESRGRDLGRSKNPDRYAAKHRPIRHRSNTRANFVPNEAICFSHLDRSHGSVYGASFPAGGTIAHPVGLSRSDPFRDASRFPACAAAGSAESIPGTTRGPTCLMGARKGKECAGSFASSRPHVWLWLPPRHPRLAKLRPTKLRHTKLRHTKLRHTKLRPMTSSGSTCRISATRPRT